MKLLFIENRYKTYFFDAICERLKDEHEIFWLLQNPNFEPEYGKINTLPFSNKPNIDLIKNNIDIPYKSIIESDRQLNFFKKKDTGYIYHYTEQINECILKIKPDVVFGEATAFHELITIELCKIHNIQYLNPSSCRYPIGRFSFYLYDTLIPYKGSEQQLSADDGQKIIENINNRDTKPDYMKKVSFSRRKKIKDKLKIISSYYKGELYNTPSPVVKFTQERKKKKVIEEWDKIAKDNINKDIFSVLYPLQMQPEANIDVWGRKYRNQYNTITKLHKDLNQDEILYIKPNPKSKYELSEKLLAYIDSHANIVALNHKVKMDDVFDDIDLFVTVTGTIAIECILSSKPVITLVNTLNNEASSCLFAEDFKTVTQLKNRVKDNSYPKITEHEKLTFLNLLNSQSYQGVISDPFSNIDCLNDKNLSNLHTAFRDILKKQPSI